MRLCPSLVPADQIEQREEIDPDNVDKVPVQTEVFNKRNVSRGIRPGLARKIMYPKNPDTIIMCRAWHAGHEEIEREVELGVDRHIRRQRLVVVFLENLGIGSRIGKRLNAEVEAWDVMLLDLLRVLDGLDAQKSRPRMNVKIKAEYQPSPAPGLRAPYAHGHGEAGADQHQRVQSAPKNIQLV